MSIISNTSSPKEQSVHYKKAQMCSGIEIEVAEIALAGLYHLQKPELNNVWFSLEGHDKKGFTRTSISFHSPFCISVIMLGKSIESSSESSSSARNSTGPAYKPTSEIFVKTGRRHDIRRKREGQVPATSCTSPRPTAEQPASRHSLRLSNLVALSVLLRSKAMPDLDGGYSSHKVSRR
ncbi:hypothetical protein KCU98_g246, partial [Aureobasidium melanogenum]